MRCIELDEAEARYFRDLVEVMDSSHRDRANRAGGGIHGGTLSQVSTLARLCR